jgi:hypothetical protein
MAAKESKEIGHPGEEEVCRDRRQPARLQRGGPLPPVEGGGDKIRAFLRRGELVAVNLAANLSGQPQWRITRESVEHFEKRRCSAPPPKPPRQKRRAVPVDYYP